MPEIREKQLVEVSNKYEALSMETDEQYEITPTSSSDKKWQFLKINIQHTNETAPIIERKAQQNWMREETNGNKEMKKMETRKKAKNTPAYEIHNKEIRKLCRDAKETFYNTKCNEIEVNLQINGSKKMHENIKELVGKKKGNSSGGCIKHNNGNMTKCLTGGRSI